MFIKGQVFFNKSSFQCIFQVEKDKIHYRFYNRYEYFYPPNNKWIELDIPEYPVIVCDFIDSFKYNLKSNKYIMDENKFDKLPVRGYKI